MNYLVQFSIRVKGPLKEMHRLEKLITETKGIWRIKLIPETTANVYFASSEVGQGVLEFQGTSGYYLDLVLNDIIDHMRSHKTHDVTCKYIKSFKVAGVLDREKHVKFTYDAIPTVTPHQIK